MAELLTEDIVWADPALPAPARGVAAVQEFMRASLVGFPDLRFDETDPAPHRGSGDQVAGAWRMRGTMTGAVDPPGFAPTGRAMKVEGVDRWTMRDGRIARYRAFYDMNDVARQLAIVPAPGSAPSGRRRAAAPAGADAAPQSGMSDFDAIVVGASVAGCTAARLYAQRGARVALVEKRPDLDAYKTVCTHFIQPSATPTIEKLGLAALIEEHGAVRNSIDLWTPYGGWIRSRGEDAVRLQRHAPGARSAPAPHHRRDTRRRAAAGHAATELLAERAPGVVVEDRQHGRRALRARLVVAADGRDSQVARLAGVPGAYAAQPLLLLGATGAGCAPAGDRSRMWLHRARLRLHASPTRTG